MMAWELGNVMTRSVVTLSPRDDLRAGAARLASAGVSGAPVIDAGKVVGVVSESDIVEALRPDKGRTRLVEMVARFIPRLVQRNEPRVIDVMTSPPKSIGPHATLWEAAELMTRRDINRLPVVDGEGRLQGIVSRADIVRMLSRDDDSIRDDVLDTIAALGETGITVVVERARVTLEGRVDRRSTKEVLVRVASRTPGVRSVEDHLEYEIDDSQVRPTASRRGDIPSPLAGEDLQAPPIGGETREHRRAE